LQKKFWKIIINQPVLALRQWVEMSRYQCALDPALLHKAKVELNEPESNDERLAIIDSVRKEFKEKFPQMQLENEDDLFILSFLRAKKFQINKTLICLRNYHVKEMEQPYVFGKIKSPYILEQIYDSGVICPMSGKAVDGSTVVIFRMGLCNFSLGEIFGLEFFILKNLALKDEINQINGFSVIHDFTLYSSSIAAKFDPKLGQSVAKTLFNYLPARINRINVTNEPRYFSLMFSFVASFMDEEWMNKVDTHGNNFSKLHESINGSFLPDFVGGTGPALNPLFWKDKLLK